MLEVWGSRTFIGFNWLELSVDLEVVPIYVLRGKKYILFGYTDPWGKCSHKALPIGSLEFRSCGLYSGSYKVIPKRNYGASG